jgi:hypothetical protein
VSIVYDVYGVVEIIVPSVFDTDELFNVSELNEPEELEFNDVLLFV